MRLEEIDYDLPNESIAQTPSEPRDSARLLVDRWPNAPEHLRIRDLPQMFGPGDVLVVNDTRVLPGRLLLTRASGGSVEILLTEPCDDRRRRWECLVRPARKLRVGEPLLHRGVETLVFLGPASKSGVFLVELRVSDPDALIRAVGTLPLPPYITERSVPDDRYQTVYSREEKSAAAPTAGLHFTEELLTKIRGVGAEICPIELVVGIDTFKPVTVADPTEHPIHTESYSVPLRTMEVCRQAKRVVAVGTTVTRALETAALTGELHGRTRLLITRDHHWKVVDMLLTNFHMPRTSLLMLVDSFVGSRWRDLYSTALQSGYRFLSFGDAMLLDRHAGERPDRRQPESERR